MFVIILNGDKGGATLRGTPLSLWPYATEEEANKAIAWQVQGGWPRDAYVKALPDGSRPGVMWDTSTGKAILIHNEGWTYEGFASFIVREWGTND